MTYSPSSSSRQQERSRRNVVDRLGYFKFNSANLAPPSPNSNQSTAGIESSFSPPASPGSQHSTIPVVSTNTSDGNLNKQQFSNRNSPPSSSRSRPPIVNPSMPQSPSKSWDEGDSAPSKSRNRVNILAQNSMMRSSCHSPIALTQVQSDLSGTSTFQPRFNLNPRIRVNEMPGRSPYDDSHQEELDISPLASQCDNNFIPSRSNRKGNFAAHDHRPPTPTNTNGTGGTSSTNPATTEDDVSSLGGVEDSTNASGTSLLKLAAALKTDIEHRPTNLTAAEITLWEVVLAIKCQARIDATESSSVASATNRSVSTIYNNLPAASERKIGDIDDVARKGTEANVKSISELQQLLSEDETEYDNILDQLFELKHLKAQSYSVICDGIDSVADLQQIDVYDTLKQNLKEIHNRIQKTESELQTFDHYRKGEEDVTEIVCFVQSKSLDNETKSKEDLLKTTKSKSDSTERLRKEVEEKSAALENAKMIITSLESSNNCITAELRAKLKTKDDEYNKLKRDSEERQKTLDALATELRDLQSSKNTRILCSEAESSRRFALSSRLERIITEIRAATVILESTRDASAVQSLGEILEDAVKVLKDGINVIEEAADDGSVNDADSMGSGNDSSRYPRSSSDAQRMRRELDERKKLIRHLEDSLRKSKDELKRLRLYTEEVRRSRDDEVHSLHAEIKILRQQCNTNMEVLTKKERELAVLRDSLQVEDLNVGYISDDNSEGDDEDDESARAPVMSLASVDYGPTQAEALATLLAQGGNHSFDAGGSGPVRTQMETLRLELARAMAEKDKMMRDLKVEKESLSNAKMIISSLERANKSMMEDLRSRLHDSNSAIATLLEKSVESEKMSSRLRAELADALQRERDRSFEEHSTSHALMILPVETID